MMMKNKVTTMKVMVIDSGDDKSDAGDIVYANKHPTLNYRPPQISTHPKGRKS